MAEDKSERFDEIGYWSEIKLEIMKSYAPRYTMILSKQSLIKGYYYIDGFAGYGIHKSKTRDELIQGSPLNALAANPPFTGHYWIDLNGKKVDYLRKLAEGHSNVKVYEGDCNKLLLEKIFPTIQFKDFKRALCLLDPYGLHLDWNVIFAAGQSKAIEIFLNFPVMDMNMNILWNNPDKVDPAQIQRMNWFWGDESWKDVAYKKTPGLFGELEEKTSNEAIAKAFCERLRNIAGFKYVAEPMPMRNSNGAIVYYLFFATPNKTADKIVQYIMDKYRNKGIK
jgi:three-Cys-motif partner protein